MNFATQFTNERNGLIGGEKKFAGFFQQPFALQDMNNVRRCLAG